MPSIEERVEFLEHDVSPDQPKRGRARQKPTEKKLSKVLEMIKIIQLETKKLSEFADREEEKNRQEAMKGRRMDHESRREGLNLLRDIRNLNE